MTQEVGVGGGGGGGGCKNPVLTPIVTQQNTLFCIQSWHKPTKISRLYYKNVFNEDKPKLYTQSSNFTHSKANEALYTVLQIVPSCKVSQSHMQWKKHHKTRDWVNNCWWGWQNRTDLGKCTHLYDETQALSTENCLHQVLSQNCLCFIVPCVSSYRWPQNQPRLLYHFD